MQFLSESIHVFTFGLNAKESIDVGQFSEKHDLHSVTFLKLLLSVFSHGEQIINICILIGDICVTNRRVLSNDSPLRSMEDFIFCRVWPHFVYYHHSSHSFHTDTAGTLVSAKYYSHTLIEAPNT